MNPDNACEVCDPSTSQRMWTAVSGCTADAGVAPADSGVAPGDSGVAPADTGVAPPADSGVAPPGDSGATAQDSGTSSGGDSGTTPPAESGGCSVGGRPNGAAAGGLALLMAVALLWRRRRI